MPGLVVDRLQAPVIENEQLDAAEGSLQTCITTVASGERQIGEQAWDTLIENGPVIPAGLMAERAGQPTLADA